MRNRHQRLYPWILLASGLASAGAARGADQLRVQAILVSDAQGGGAPRVTAEQVRAAVRQASRTFSGADVEFTFDPESDVATQRNDLLFQDCTLSPTADLLAPRDRPPACDERPNNDERNRVAQSYPGKIVVYFSRGVRPRYDDVLQRWVMDGARGVNWSNHVDSFVLMNPADPLHILEHELGHYLHLVHTFYTSPTSLDEARAQLRDYVVRNGGPASDAAVIYDADQNICLYDARVDCITDTPPDPGEALFRAAGLNPCDPAQGTLPLVVQLPSGPFTYTFMPDRQNVMSYWNKSCLGLPASITPDQAAAVHSAITASNRSPLIDPRIQYTAVWEPGDRGSSAVMGWGMADFAGRFNQEIAAGKHLAHMQAYDLGGGQMRWDGVWEDGARGTTRAIGWGMGDFATRFNQEINSGKHLVHMQAYDLGAGQMRWDGVWEDGARGTTRAIGWGMGDFATRFNQEISSGKHLVHMQAYDLGGGQIRWDGVWEDGQRDTDYVLGWGFNDFVEHLEQENAAGRRLVRQQAYDVGGGQIRYDGVWESNTDGVTQTRVLSESLYRFADRFNQESAQGRHVRLMQAFIGGR